MKLDFHQAADRHAVGRKGAANTQVKHLLNELRSKQLSWRERL